MKAIITNYDLLKGYARLRPLGLTDAQETSEEAVSKESPSEYFFHVSQVQSYSFPGIAVGTCVTFEPLEPESNLVRWVKIQD